MTEALYDKHGREIKRGDIVKVFHFIGARNKRHYMYKHCLGIVEVGANKWRRLKFSHLNLADSEDRSGFYDETPDGRVMDGYEIVQSVVDDFEDRPRALIQQVAS